MTEPHAAPADDTTHPLQATGETTGHATEPDRVQPAPESALAAAAEPGEPAVPRQLDLGASYVDQVQEVTVQDGAVQDGAAQGEGGAPQLVTDPAADLEESGHPSQDEPGHPIQNEDAAENAGTAAADLPHAAEAPHQVTDPVADLQAESARTEAAEQEAPAEQETPDDAGEPRTTFADLGLSPEILEALEAKGYAFPTPIQAQAIPSVLMGRDVLGTAQTGTGKTASFVLPLLDILTGKRARARMPRCLILEPTRELALQVAENFVQYGSRLKLTHALLIGGESMGEQRDAVAKGVDVLIATPGRLMDLFERGGLLLTDCAVLVIDEADRMLDMGFIPDVEKIVGFLPSTRQTLFFSATMAPEIRRLADAFLREPKEIAVSRPSSVATTIVAGLTIVDDLDKREALRRLLRREEVGNALIFCNRKRDVDILFKSLKRHGFSVGQLHGDMSQPERFATLGRFKAGELQLLVCSDVAARGIDIGGLSHVFNFDVPIHAEDYVHRIGRTGRAGMTGHAYTLATPDDRVFVEAIEKMVGAPIPRFQVDGLDPLEFAEGDRKRGRGRGRTEKPARAKTVVADDSVREAAAKDGGRTKRGRGRGRRDETAIDPAQAPQPELPASLPALPAEQTTRRSRDDRGRDDRNRDGRSQDDRNRDDRSRDDRRESSGRDESRDSFRDDRRNRFRDENRRFRRDDDLGPAVLGFGDDIPAFMLLRSRIKPAATAEAE